MFNHKYGSLNNKSKFAQKITDYELTVEVLVDQGCVGFNDLNDSEKNELLGDWLCDSNRSEPSEFLNDLCDDRTLSEFMYGSISAEDIGLKIKKKLLNGDHIKRIDDDIYQAHLKKVFSEKGYLSEDEDTQDLINEDNKQRLPSEYFIWR
jgi:hypothetical protein